MRKTPKGYKYNQESGEIHRNGELVATVTGDVITYASDSMRRYAPPVAAILANQKVDTIASISEPPETANTVEETVVIDSPTSPDPVDTEEVIPPMPESDPQLGSKTHAIVDWYRKYYPEEFQRMYQGKHIYLGILQEDGSFKPVPDPRRRRGGIPLGRM